MGRILVRQRVYFAVGLEKDLFRVPSFFTRQKRCRENGYVKTDVVTRALALCCDATGRPKPRDGAFEQRKARSPIFSSQKENSTHYVDR